MREESWWNSLICQIIFIKKTRYAQGPMADLDVFGPIQVQQFKNEKKIWNRDGTDIFRGPISASWALILQSLASRCLQQGNSKTSPNWAPSVMLQTIRKGDGFSSSPTGDFVKTFKTTGSDKYFLMRKGATGERKPTFFFIVTLIVYSFTDSIINSQAFWLLLELVNHS